jgi:predicted  nucleic acid-binding Zn-ribbon protein
MLTTAFRGFGGEELVKDHLTALPGGFWTQFIVVMAVIFFLGFFLDFLEIAVVVVPIVAPILLADPSANVTAVWFGVMVGLNIQTSFLTPPFGFSLFYLRGVAPPDVRTTQIYKGAAAFIALQLLGLAIAGVFPGLVNYLPNKTQLVSETAPPPNNPKLQECLENYLFAEYDNRRAELEQSIAHMQSIDMSGLPDEYQDRLQESYARAGKTFELVAAVRAADSSMADYSPQYRPLHVEVRGIQNQIHKLGDDIEELDQQAQRIKFSDDVDQPRIDAIQAKIASIKDEQKRLQAEIPAGWDEARAQFNSLAKAEKTARLRYRQNVDDSYATISLMQSMLAQTDALAALQARIDPLIAQLRQDSAEASLAAVDALADEIDLLAETHDITSRLSRAKRALRGDSPETEKAIAHIIEAGEVLRAEVDWRRRAAALADDLQHYDQTIATTLGMRMQQRLTSDQAESIASCLSVHRDVSLYF